MFVSKSLLVRLHLSSNPVWRPSLRIKIRSHIPSISGRSEDDIIIEQPLSLNSRTRL